MIKLVLLLTLISQIARSFVVDYEQLYSFTSYAKIPDEDSVGYLDPRPLGGSMLDQATPFFGEPLNVIISANSDPHVLSNQGLLDFAKSVGFAAECLNLHIGGKQFANLDGHGWFKENIELRQSYFPYFGAWFLAVSKEKKIKERHKILEDGYNLGRDDLASKALLGGSGNGYSFRTSIEWIDGLIEPGSNGINHHIPQDGRVAVLTRVHIVTDLSQQIYTRFNMRLGTFFTKSAEQLHKQATGLKSSSSNKLLSISKNTPNFATILSSDNTIGCLTDPFKARSVDDVYSLSYAELPSTAIPFHAPISGRNAPTVGRWIRKHVIDDDELGELPDFSKWDKNSDPSVGIWSGRRSRSVALPQQLDGDPLNQDSIKSLIYFTEPNSEDFVHNIHQRFPHAKKLGLALPHTPFETGFAHTLSFPGGAIVGGGLVGFGSTEENKTDAPTINFEGYSPFSDVLKVTNASGNIILMLNNANACRQLLELLNKNRIDKEDEYYVAAYNDNGSIKTIHRITSGDPSRGAIALDTTDDLTLAHGIQFMKRQTTSTQVQVDPTPAVTKSPTINAVSSRHPLISLPLEDALVAQDCIHIENEFIVASELGFNTSTNPKQTPWSCKVEASAKLLL
ncbi:hypothetical protein E3P96_03511 [Wallemia ichthyophaga]|nr:hypothetical protein E3P96_03511 [Wallemia ichthyophaga]